MSVRDHREEDGSRSCVYHEDHTHTITGYVMNSFALSLDLTPWSQPGVCNGALKGFWCPFGLEPPPQSPCLAWPLDGGLPLGTGCGFTCPQLPEWVHLPSKPQPDILTLSYHPFRTKGPLEAHA